MTSLIVWIIIFLLISAWFIIGYNNSNEYKRTEEYKRFLKSTKWKKLENLEWLMQNTCAIYQLYAETLNRGKLESARAAKELSKYIIK